MACDTNVSSARRFCFDDLPDGISMGAELSCILVRCSLLLRMPVQSLPLLTVENSSTDHNLLLYTTWTYCCRCILCKYSLCLSFEIGWLGWLKWVCFLYISLRSSFFRSSPLRMLTEEIIYRHAYFMLNFAGRCTNIRRWSFVLFGAC